MELLVYSNYGALRMNTPTAFPDLGAAWQKITVFDSGGPSSQAVPDPNNDTIRFDQIGVYCSIVTGAFEHNSSNQGRSTNIRYYNETDGVPASVPSPIIPTGRNAEATTVSTALLVPVLEDNLGDEFSLQIGNGDTYSSVIWNSLDWSLFQVGPFSIIS